MSRFCFCNCPAGFSAEPERHAPDCPGRSGAGKARTPVPATLTASQPVESGVDFGIDGRSVRVSQEAYSIFLAREADGREKIAALQQRLTAADERADQAVIALNEIARVSRMGEKPFEIATLAIGEMSAGIEQPAPVAVLPERLQQVLKFLDGAENLDGHWFGEPHPSGRPYWWRNELRKSLAETNLFAKQQ